MNRKLEQLSSSIHRAVQEVIARGLHDPRVSGLITVMGVRINPETQEAFIGISVLPEEKQELTVHGLRAASKHIRREVGDLVRTRTMPTLVFQLDDSLKKQAAVSRAIAKAAEELGPLPEGAPEEGSEPQPETPETPKASGGWGKARGTAGGPTEGTR
jgi:ribosome-binding factor A